MFWPKFIYIQSILTFDENVGASLQRHMNIKYKLFDYLSLNSNLVESMIHTHIHSKTVEAISGTVTNTSIVTLYRFST